MELPPTPGVSSLTSKYSYANQNVDQLDGRPPPGASPSGRSPIKQGSQDHLPAHLRDEGDRDYAISHFPAMPLGLPNDPNEPVGYVVQIPLDKKAIASSRVRNGALPESVYKKYAHFYEDDQKPAQKKLAAAPLSDDLEIADDDPVEKVASKTDQIGQLPPYDPAGSRQMTKKVNQPMTWETESAKVGPGDVQERGDKNMYDTIKKTKVPWEQYKKASWVNAKVEKFAQHFGLDAAQISSDQFWSDPDTDPLSIDLTLVGNFGKEWISWEPETLWEMIGRIGGQNLSEEVRNKVQALKTMHSGDYFWEDEGIFEKICLALNGIQPNFEERQHLSIPQMAKAVGVSLRVKSATFSDEVAAHVASRGHQEGFLLLPPILSFAQSALSSLQTGLEALVAQVQKAYSARLTPGAGDDPLSVQLRKLYAVENYMTL